MQAISHTNFDASLSNAYGLKASGLANAGAHTGIEKSNGLRIGVTYALLLGALTFNFFLAIVNANMFATGGSLVIASEMLLVMIALILALSNRIAMPLILVGFVTYLFFLMAMRPELDLKAVRDFLVPFVFYFVGRNIGDARQLDRFVLAAAIIVVGFGVFEYLMLDSYIKLVQPVQYYISRGSVVESELNKFSQDTGLFASGQRYGARVFLNGILNNSRVSSVFLEPVSMGNFGVVIYMWALFRRNMSGRFLLLGLAAVIIVLADARFGMFGCIAATLAMIIAPLISRHLLFALPFIIMAGLLFYGQYTVAVLWEDDFAGRILWSSKIAASLTPEHILGISADKIFVADNGFAHALTQFGIFGAAFVWALLAYSSGPNLQAWHFRLAVGCYLAINLSISNSAFSIKTIALVFVMLGAADCRHRVVNKLRTQPIQH